jgi:multisubunit Na+/H+ antiporter MnhE subunit
LSRDQIVASNWFGLCIALALASLVAWAFGNQDAKISALVFGLLVVPLAGTFHCDQGWPRTAMGAVAAALALLGCIAASPVVLRPLLSEPAFELVDAASVLALLGFVVGVFASQFIANALASVTPRR